MNRNHYLLLIIIFAGIFLYLPSLTIPFFSDEVYFIQRNEAENVNEFFSLFEKKDYDGYYYRPAGNIVSSLLTAVVSYQTVYYRIFNLLLHIINSLLIYFFVLNLIISKKNKETIALFASLFFISFPLHDYAVIWHTDLFDRILLMFYLSSLILHIKENKFSLLSLLFFLLAFLSKESAVSFPLVIFVFHFLTEGSYKLKYSFNKALPYAIIVIAVILFRLIVLNDNIFKADDAHSAANILTVIKNMILFSGMTIFPFYLREIQSIISGYPYVLFAFLFFLFPLYKFIKSKKEVDPYLIILILFFIIALLPASRLLMRWYLYIPSVGFVAALSYFIFQLEYKWKYTGTIISVTIFLIYGATTFSKLNEWNEVTNEGDIILKNFVTEFKEVIKESDEIHFITLPAKIGDIPVFQLAFGQHLNFYLDEEKEISVLSKSHLTDFNDSIKTELINGDYLITNFNENYFIVFDKEKLTFVGQSENGNYKREQIIIPVSKKQNVSTFSFSKGSFYQIPGK